MIGRPRRYAEQSLVQLTIRISELHMRQLEALCVLGSCSASEVCRAAIETAHKAITPEQQAAIQIIRAAKVQP